MNCPFEFESIGQFLTHFEIVSFQKKPDWHKQALKLYGAFDFIENGSK
jgi:hypothetical protein